MIAKSKYLKIIIYPLNIIYILIVSKSNIWLGISNDLEYLGIMIN